MPVQLASNISIPISIPTVDVEASAAPTDFISYFLSNVPNPFERPESNNPFALVTTAPISLPTSNPTDVIIPPAVFSKALAKVPTDIGTSPAIETCTNTLSSRIFSVLGTVAQIATRKDVLIGAAVISIAGVAAAVAYKMLSKPAAKETQKPLPTAVVANPKLFKKDKTTSAKIQTRITQFFSKTPKVRT